VVLAALSADSDLARWYNERFGKGGKRLRKIGIVALARKLLIACGVTWKTASFRPGHNSSQSARNAMISLPRGFVQSRV